MKNIYKNTEVQFCIEMFSEFTCEFLALSAYFRFYFCMFYIYIPHY